MFMFFFTMCTLTWGCCVTNNVYPFMMCVLIISLYVYLFAVFQANLCRHLLNLHHLVRAGPYVFFVSSLSIVGEFSALNLPSIDTKIQVLEYNSFCENS